MPHTPGPWRVNERFDVIASLSTGWEPTICSLVEGRFSQQPSVALHIDEVQANARLIAAAPALLAALQALLAECEVYRGFDYNAGLLADARAAIARAEGKSSSDPATTSDQS